MGGRIFSPKVPLAPGNCVFLFLARARNFSKCPRPRTGQNTIGPPFPTEKSCSREICGNPSRIAWWHFFRFRDPCCSGAQKGPCRAACLLAAACCRLLARRAGSTLVPSNLINRLKYHVLQLGDPNPNPQGGGRDHAARGPLPPQAPGDQFELAVRAPLLEELRRPANSRGVAQGQAWGQDRGSSWCLGIGIGVGGGGCLSVPWGPSPSTLGTNP